MHGLQVPKNTLGDKFHEGIDAGDHDSRLLSIRWSSQGGGDRGGPDADGRDSRLVSRSGNSHHEAKLPGDVDGEEQNSFLRILFYHRLVESEDPCQKYP